jgi:serine/threonine protein kinase
MGEEPSLQLGKYRLLGRIGYGGMAEVWVAHQQGPMGFEKLVAIKRLLPHMEHERQFVHMFLDEARIAARINHANVVQIFDLGMVEQTFFIAMEYLDGESLARVMGEGIKRKWPLPVPLAAAVVSQMCKGLHHAHALSDVEGRPLGIVHRDVSPQNVMILYDGSVKLLDFGVAKARERFSETTTTGMKGKYAYMSPEQCQGLPLDHRSDIFACGIVLWETITQRRLFKHPSKLMILKMITEGRVPPPSRYNPEIPPELDAVALKALCKLPSERFISGMEMSGALDDYLASSGQGSSAAQLSEYMEQVFGEDHRTRISWIGSASAKPQFIEGLHTSEYWLDLVPDSPDTVVSFSRSAVGTAPGRRLPRQSPIWWILTAVIATLAAVAATILLLMTPLEPSAARLRLESNPSGAMVVIDGKLHEGKTPGVIDPIEPGTHEVEVVLKGHQPWRREITVAQGETLRVEATLHLVPPEDAGQQAQALPDARAESPPDARLALSAPDARPPVPATVPDAEARAAVPPVAKVPQPKEPREPEKPEEPKELQKPRPKPIKDSFTPAPRPREVGLLNLATVPWATIYHGRKKLGDSPLVRAKLPAGQVTLRAVNKAAGINTTFTVTIAKGKLARRTVDLRRLSR